MLPSCSVLVQLSLRLHGRSITRVLRLCQVVQDGQTITVVYAFAVARQKAFLASTTLDDITEFLESQGRLWGARHEPVRRAELVGWQVVEALTSHHLVAGPLSEIEVETGFDEYIFTLIVRYRGGLLPLAKQPPSAEELMASTEAELQMAGYLVSQSAHSARASSNARAALPMRRWRSPSCARSPSAAPRSCAVTASAPPAAARSA